MYMGTLPLCMSMHHVYAWCPWRLEEGFGSPENGVTDSGEHRVNAGNQPRSSGRAAGALNN